MIGKLLTRARASKPIVRESVLQAVGIVLSLTEIARTDLQTTPHDFEARRSCYCQGENRFGHDNFPGLTSGDTWKPANEDTSKPANGGDDKLKALAEAAGLVALSIRS